MVVNSMSYATYDSYKESGVDWLGEIPSDWQSKKLGILLTEFSKKNNPNLPLLSITRELGVITRDMDDQESNHNFIPDDLSGYKLLKEGQFGMNKMKAWQGSYGISKYTGIVSPAYYVFDVSNEIYPNFFNIAIRSKFYVDFFGSASDGVRIGQWDLNKTRMREIPFIFPSLEQQKKIYEFLSKKIKQIDQAISLKQQQIEKLGEYKQIVIQNAVTKGLNPNVPMKDSGVEWIGDIPEHWDVKKLKYVLKSYNKKISSRNSDLRYLGMENIISKTGEINNESAEVEGLANHFKPNHILFGKLRPYLAKVYLADFEGICSTEFLVFEVLEPNNAKFLQILLLSNGFIQNIDSSTYGSKMPRANPDFINNQFIAIPPLDEQLQIINAIENKNQPIKQAIEKYQTQIDRLKEYKNILINQAVTGKIKI